MAKTNPDEALDLAIALSLEEQFKKESREEQKKYYNLPKESSGPKYDNWDPRSVVDHHWELTDPNPNIHDLFVQFDSMFFWSTLLNKGVAVRWSKRMTLCAGTCSYEGRGGLCSIQLSEPLLKLRPRKDLVETLLHEMIHAYLFVTDNNTDHDGHGPNFLSHMHRINNLTGASISVFHSFHDEVKEYRQHWWKCNGPCQHRPPYYGLVTRAMNRAPSPRDPWWAKHQSTCGGTYVKIKEPENYKNKKKSVKEEKNKKAAAGSRDIKDMFAGAGSSNTGSKTKDGNAGRSSGESSNVKPFHGQGRSLGNSGSSERKVVPVEVGSSKSSTDDLSLRERMLIAAEKRRSANETRGSKTVGKKRPRLKSPDAGPSSYDIRQFSDEVSQQTSGFKKTKLEDSNESEDIIVLDSPPIAKVSPPVWESSSHNPPVKTTETTIIIDLSSDKEAKREEPSSSKPAAVSGVQTENHVITLNDSGEEISLSDLTQFKTCPVCGMSNIPAAIINAHVSFCLDAEEESMMVDDNDL